MGRTLEKLLGNILFRNNNGTYVLEEDWDYLIILDACRYDMFAEEIKSWDIEGKLEQRTSRGQETVCFLQENFNVYHDEIVYISTNPRIDKCIKNKVHKVIPVWDFGWDKNLKTVHPEQTYKYALKAVSNYRTKRILIHFVQPHQPFIRLDKNKWGKIGGMGYEKDVSIWKLLQEGKLSREEVLWGYRENLKIAMPYVEKLCKLLNGKIVITADHGNAIGEKIHPIIPKKHYGHGFRYIRSEPLVKVPWLVTKGKGDKKTIEKELIQQRINSLRNKI